MKRYHSHRNKNLEIEIQIEARVLPYSDKQFKIPMVTRVSLITVGVRQNGLAYPDQGSNAKRAPSNGTFLIKVLKSGQN
jgi:hypothetical protein